MIIGRLEFDYRQRNIFLFVTISQTGTEE